MLFTYFYIVDNHSMPNNRGSVYKFQEWAIPENIQTPPTEEMANRYSHVFGHPRTTEVNLKILLPLSLRTAQISSVGEEWIFSGMTQFQSLQLVFWDEYILVHE